MKLYTKKGDQGETSLIGGKRVLKCDANIDSYGSVDELNSWIGLIMAQEAASPYHAVLLQIQNNLFVIGSQLASDPGKPVKELPMLKEGSVQELEAAIDEMDQNLESLKQFILPSGSEAVAICHIARATCRRAERAVVAQAQEREVDPFLIQYLNRLSDYLFTLARKVAHDTNTSEVLWDPSN